MVQHGPISDNAGGFAEMAHMGHEIREVTDGDMLPFWFSAMTMKSVGIAAMGMVNEIRRQFQDPKIADGTKEPDYQSCVAIATEAALHEMVAPACLVLFTPIFIGILFGKYTLAGVLPGALISGVQLARNAPSTIGALLSTAFIRIGQELDGVEELDGAHAAALLETAARSVAELILQIRLEL